MARRKSDSPQKAAMREMMQGYLKENDISIKSGNDVNSIMRDMMSVLLEGVLDEELNEELGYSKYDYRNKETDNSRNGHSRKTMRTSYGDMDIAIPRDRKGEYEPQLIPKYQNTVTQDMEEKIISMYAKGMTTGDIEAHLKELYDLDISDSTISRITDKIMPLVKEWQASTTGDICCCLHGCDPLPRPQRRAYCETCGIHCPWDRYGWEKGCDRHVCWGK
jgi:transposase-like protein